MIHLVHTIPNLQHISFYWNIPLRNNPYDAINVWSNTITGNIETQREVTYSSRVELNAVWKLVIAETSDTLTSLRVPKFDVTVVAGADKIGAIVVEADVLYSLTMTYTDQPQICVYLCSKSLILNF